MHLYGYKKNVKTDVELDFSDQTKTENGITFSSKIVKIKIIPKGVKSVIKVN